VDSERRTPLTRVLGIVTEVRPGEAAMALLLTCNVLLLLTAYAIIKPLRDGLILAMPSGAEYKSYMSAAITVALVGAVPAYAWLADKWPRNRLVVFVTLFFASHLLLFYVGAGSELLRRHLGLIFYLWVGVFNMMVVAQFWSFANDVYSEEQGKRLFPLLALGQTVGAVFGSSITVALVSRIGSNAMLLVAAVLLGASAFLTQAVHRRSLRNAASGAADAAVVVPTQEVAPADPAARRGAFALVFGSKYLRLIAIYSVVFSLLNSNGDYMLGKLFKASADESVAAGIFTPAQAKEYLSGAYGAYYLGVNVLTVVFQSLVVSRLVKYGGLRAAFLVFPLLALVDSVALMFAPLLLIARVGRTLESATDYSINNTVRNMLWLPTSRAVKYKAKQAVDTFFVRLGDVSSAALVYAAAMLLHWGVRAFAVANFLLVIVWLFLAAAIVREYARQSAAVGAK
jgi:AAA family ATP:ADP antiporter